MDSMSIQPRIDPAVVRMLKNAGADTYARDRLGATPWDLVLPFSGLEPELASEVNIDLVFILGPPGSGKSSQAKKLGSGFDFKVFTIDSCLETAAKTRRGVARE